MTDGTPACARATRKFPNGRTATMAGYMAHHRAGEPLCQPCIDARSATRIGVPACGDVAGTIEGHRAHVKAGQLPCKPCRDGIAASDMACVFPSINHPDGRTGTSAGYQVHRSNGQEPCVKCAAAQAVKSNERWTSLPPDELAAHRILNAAAARQYVARDPERARQIKHRTIQKNRAAVHDAKNRPCIDCGVRYPYYVMQFDHLDSDSKQFNIGAGVTCASHERILAEIAKCEVVCANCHAERTHQRREARLSSKRSLLEVTA